MRRTNEFRDAPKDKTGKCANSSQVGDPPPVWEPHVIMEKKIVVFPLLHLRMILACQKSLGQISKDVGVG